MAVWKCTLFSHAYISLYSLNYKRIADKSKIEKSKVLKIEACIYIWILFDRVSYHFHGEIIASFSSTNIRNFWKRIFWSFFSILLYRECIFMNLATPKSMIMLSEVVWRYTSHQHTQHQCKSFYSICTKHSYCECFCSKSLEILQLRTLDFDMPAIQQVMVFNAMT